MGTVVALGESPAVAGYALAGARVIPAGSPERVREAWAALPADAVVILTPRAAAAVMDKGAPEGPLWVVLPS